MTSATQAASGASLLQDAEKPPILGWLAAALVILAVHGLIAYLLLRQSEDAQNGQESPPAVLIQMAPPSAPPAQPDTDLPPAPEKTEESTDDMKTPDPDVMPPPVEEAPEVTQEKPEVVVPESPLAPKPEVVFAQVPKPPAPPKPKVEKKIDRLAKPVHKPRAERTAAPRQMNAAPSRETAASEAGVPTMSTASWQAQVSARLNSVKRCAGGGGSGVATVGFAVSGGGGVGGARLVRSSGNGILDAEAVAMIHRGAPYPPTPSGGTVSLTVPIRFSCGG